MNRRAFLALWLLLGLLALAEIGGFVWLLSLNHSIQAERRDSIVSSCRDQNQRHDKTIAQLNKAKADADAKFNKQHPRDGAAQAAHAKSTAAGVATFALIFNASTPHRNCAALAAKYVNQGG